MMLKTHTTKYRLIGIYVNLLLLAVSLFLVFAVEIGDLRFWGCYGFCISVFLFGLYALINHKLITPFSLFFISFCIFQYGQFYLYGFGIEYDYVFFHPYYSKFIDKMQIFTVVKFTLLSIQAMMLAGILVGVKEQKFVLQDNSDTLHLKRIGKVLFWISLPASAIMTVVQVLFSVRYGYESIRTGSTGAIVASLNIFNRLAVFYVPALILLWIVNTGKKKTQIIYEILMIIHILAYLIIGQRTIGLGLAVTLILLKLNNAKKIKPQTMLLIILLGIGLMGLSNYVGNARLADAGSGGIGSLLGGVINFIGSCGWSCFPLMVIVGSTPRAISFSNGLSYLGSILGFFPSFIDPSGSLRVIAEYVSDNWLTNYARTTFGIGYSLTAEAYYNFAWYGIFAIFIIGMIVAFILNCTKHKLSTFRYYVQMAMTYALFTLPRRGIYDLFNYLFYFVFVFWLLKKISKALTEKKISE